MSTQYETVAASDKQIYNNKKSNATGVGAAFAAGAALGAGGTKAAEALLSEEVTAKDEAASDAQVTESQTAAAQSSEAQTDAEAQPQATPEPKVVYVERHIVETRIEPAPQAAVEPTPSHEEVASEGHSEETDQHVHTANEPDVRIVDVHEENLGDGVVVTVGRVDGLQTDSDVLVVDVDQDSVFDYAMSDLNHNRQLDEGEIIDISEAGIAVPDMPHTPDSYMAENGESGTNALPTEENDFPMYDI